MATSGSYDFDLTRNEIIEEAYKNIGQLPDGQSLSAEQFSRASNVLNMMVKNWRADSIFLWNLDWITVPFTASSVVNGSDGNDYECIRSHTSAAENKPVTGSKYSSFWKALTTTAGSAWATSTAYTSIANPTMDTNIVSIEEGRLRQISTETTQPLSKVTKNQYFNITDALSEGDPIQYWFRRKPTPELFFYPYPDSATDYVAEFLVYRFPEDFDASTDNADFLQEWLLPLTKGLSAQLAPQVGIFGGRLNDIERQAAEAKERAEKLDHEFGVLKFEPQIEGLR